MAATRQLIKNGELQSDFDCKNFRLLNIGDNGSGGPYVPITRTINGHNLSSNVVLDLATDFGLSVTTIGLALLVLDKPASEDSYMLVGVDYSVTYRTPSEMLTDLGLTTTSDVTFGNLFVGTDGDMSGLSSHFTVGKSSDSTQYLDFNASTRIAIRNASGTGAMSFITSGLTVDRAYTMPDASGTLALTSDLNLVSDTAYDATTWNGVTTIAPSKNAVRDKIESMVVAANPMTTTGDLIYGGTLGVQTRLAGNTTTVHKFLRQIGDGVNSAAPAWSELSADEIIGLGSSSDAVFGNVFVGTNGDFASLTALFTVGATSGVLNQLVFEDSEYLYLQHKATSFGTYFDTSLLAADRTVKLPDASGTFELVEWTIRKTTHTAKSGEKLQADTLEGAFTITLPAAPAVGDSVQIEDATSNWGSSNLTIARNGLRINGAASNFTASTDDQKLSCVYISADWGWSIK